MEYKKIAVLTSGGDAPGMNAAIRAVVRKSIYHGLETVGVERGYQGLMNGEFLSLSLNSVGGIINQGGTVLRTSRSEEFKTPAGLQRAINHIQEAGIQFIVIIGGDGSLAGARRLSAAGIATAVIPASIDNDMQATEYSIGFDTALNTIVDAVRRIRDTVESHERVAIIEVMGRNCGHLALASGIACGVEAILMPEVYSNIDGICRRLYSSSQYGKKCTIVIVAEGAGKATDIARQIEDKTGFAVSITILGYIQRGGHPSAMDNIMASRMGGAVVDELRKGHCNFLAAVKNGQVVTVPYCIAATDSGKRMADEYELSQILAGADYVAEQDEGEHNATDHIAGTF